MNQDGQAGANAILISGMHRSGTSALTRILNLLGTELGNDLLPPHADNPHGYWESGAAVALNDGAWMQGWRQRAANYVTENFIDSRFCLPSRIRASEEYLRACLAVLRELGIAPHACKMPTTALQTLQCQVYFHD